jgi:hypothetical protein
MDSDRFPLNPLVLLAGAEETTIFQDVTRYLNNHGLVHTYSRDECLKMGITPAEWAKMKADRTIETPYERELRLAQVTALMPQVMGCEF